MAGTLSGGYLNAQIASLFYGYELLAYVGEREKLWIELVDQRWQKWHKITKGVFSDIGRILKPLIGVDLSGSATADELSRIFEDKEKRKLVAVKLGELQGRLNDQKRHFYSVEARLGKNPILSATQPPADSLVCVEGCLALGSAILQYYPQGVEQLGTPDAWFLTDGPPNAIRKDNEDFNGQFLILDLEPGFETHFDDHIPFWRDIGWFPYVRITGYFRTRSKRTRELAALSVGLIEYRGPKGYLEGSRELAKTLQLDLGSTYKSSDYLQSLTTKAYLAPLIYKGSKQGPKDTPTELLPWLKDLQRQVGNQMPRTITGFYDGLP